MLLYHETMKYFPPVLLSIYAKQIQFVQSARILGCQKDHSCDWVAVQAADTDCHGFMKYCKVLIGLPTSHRKFRVVTIRRIVDRYFTHWEAEQRSL